MSHEDIFLESLLEKNVYLLFMHGTIVFDGIHRTYKKFTIPDDQTIVSFTTPGEVLLMNRQLGTYFTHNSNARKQTLLPLLSVNDSSDLYGKAEELYWFMNNLHIVPAKKPLAWDVTETPREILSGYKTQPFRGGKSQVETIYRSDGGSTYPDMRFGRSDGEEKYMGLFYYGKLGLGIGPNAQSGGGGAASKPTTSNVKGIERIDIPKIVKLSDISEMLPPNSILFTMSCAAWQTEFHYRNIGTLIVNTNPDELGEGAREALRSAETLVRENDLEYKATHPLLSSKSAAGWATFRRLFGRVRIPVLSFYIDRETNKDKEFTVPTFAITKENIDDPEDEEEKFKTAVGYMDPISMQNFKNANAGLVTWASPKNNTQKAGRRRHIKRRKTRR